MNEKTLAAVSLSNRDFPSFEARLAEAAKWVDHAADMGADLVVLPEALNYYRGDGEGSARTLRAQDVALTDWQTSCAILLETAVRRRLALTIPVITREGDHLTNSSFLVGRDGTVLGRYQKMRPVPGEIKAGIQPGKVSLIDWEGLKIGGGICFDCYFPGCSSSRRMPAPTCSFAPASPRPARI
jgi:predicted amidohydrolase